MGMNDGEKGQSWLRVWEESIAVVASQKGDDRNR